MATITVTGNLTSDPELRFTPSGKAVLSFGLAENHHRRDAAGGWEQTGTTFYSVTRWGGQSSSAEVDAIAESLSKGARVIVTGRLQARSWTDREENTRSTLEITAEEVGASFKGVAGISVHRAPRAGESRQLAAVPDTNEPPF